MKIHFWGIKWKHGKNKVAIARKYFIKIDTIRK